VTHVTHLSNAPGLSLAWVVRFKVAVFSLSESELGVMRLFERGTCYMYLQWLCFIGQSYILCRAFVWPATGQGEKKLTSIGLCQHLESNEIAPQGSSSGIISVISEDWKESLMTLWLNILRPSITCVWRSAIVFDQRKKVTLIFLNTLQYFV